MQEGPDRFDRGTLDGAFWHQGGEIRSKREHLVSIAILMVLVAALLGPVTGALAKAGGEGFDNRAPRSWLEAQTGWRKRAEWAQRNHVEAFAPFGIAVALALASGALARQVDFLALGFVGARVVYTAFYLANLATLRSIAWSIGVVLTVTLLVVAARAYG